MEWVTTTAKTLPEAIDLALDNLGVDESEAEIVVLEEPSKGLFGRTRGAARVEARVKPKAIRPKVERSRGRRSRPSDGSRGDRSGRNRGSRDRSNGSTRRSKVEAESPAVAEGRAKDDSTSNAAGSRAATNRQSKKQSSGRPAGPSSGRSGGQSNSESDRKTRNDAKDGGDGSPGSRSRRRRRRGTPNGDQTAPSKNTTKEQETPVEEVEQHLREFLGGLTEAFGLDGAVEIDRSESDVLVATIQGQHGLMVGPKGRTLDAIQELARVSSQRAAPSSLRIRVDVGGYRQQRAGALAGFARKAADKAVDNGREVALEPMSPADRKAIHDALVDDARVETRSVGTEPRRRVIVIPVGVDAGSDEEE